MSPGKMKALAIVPVVFALGACGSTSQPTYGNSTSPASAASTSSASGYGVVQSIDVVQRQAQGSALGMVGGAVVGGLLGNQIGSGTGRTAATVAGAAGGALAGNQVSKNMSAGEQSYRVVVVMDNGSTQTLTQDAPPAVQKGERVRLQNGAIVERIAR
ncbi:glycine zipper 2TM domain-containing protein [Noviherbaspirillum cavernae]|uniref:Glycine zipper 2TM domain-containing protein n=1 Tax=Noviherbaspirillum cavernae TaxID=2320862 RepID=A0A418X2L7_9BURK|nr:glycine zipper 2TM domain-containing protein [Noviherbaspirillum cavernae]RJG06713.1 glycine zipper 2TM domain-containing protein [Noviherbaspirillum cavernae]